MGRCAVRDRGIGIPCSARTPAPSGSALGLCWPGWPGGGVEQRPPRSILPVRAQRAAMARGLARGACQDASEGERGSGEAEPADRARLARPKAENTNHHQHGITGVSVAGRGRRVPGGLREARSPFATYSCPFLDGKPTSRDFAPRAAEGSSSGPTGPEASPESTP